MNKLSNSIRQIIAHSSQHYKTYGTELYWLVLDGIGKFEIWKIEKWKLTTRKIGFRAKYFLNNN